METVVGEKPADLEVLTVFANAVFESCPDYGLTWWELSHCEALCDYDSLKLYPVYRDLSEHEYLESVPVSATQHATNARNAGEPLHPGVRVIRITDIGMKSFGQLVSKAMENNN